jgi:hypothetical protein
MLMNYECLEVCGFWSQCKSYLGIFFLNIPIDSSAHGVYIGPHGADIPANILLRN